MNRKTLAYRVKERMQMIEEIESSKNEIDRYRVLWEPIVERAVMSETGNVQVSVRRQHKGEAL